MSLAKRLQQMEARIKGLEEQVAGLTDNQERIVDAIEAGADEGDEQEAQPERDLDGNVYGGERDQTQSLDG